MIWDPEGKTTNHRTNSTISQSTTATPPLSGIQLPTPWSSESSNQAINPSLTTTVPTCEIRNLLTPSSNQRDSNGNLLTIKGETYINEIAISPLGSLLVIGEKHGLSMYSADTFERIWFRETQYRISSVSFSPDGQLLVTGTNNGSIILWDSKTGDQLQVLSGPETHVVAIFSKEGCKVASIADEGAAHLWDIISGEEILSMTLNDPLLKLFLHSPDGLLHAIDTNFSGIWNPELELEFHDQDLRLVIAMALSPDQSILALGTTPITLWDTGTGKLLNTLDEIQYGYVNQMSFAHDGITIAFGTFNGSVYLWNIENDTPQRILPTERGDLAALQFSPDSTTLYAAYQPPNLYDDSQSNWLVAWDISAREELRSINLKAFPPLRVSISNQEAYITSFVHNEGLAIETWEASAKSGSITLAESIDLEEWKCVPYLSHSTMSMDGKRLATLGSSCEEGIVIWDLATGTVVQVFPRPPIDIYHLAISPDGSLLLAPEDPTDLALWDVERGEKLYSLPNIPFDSNLTPVFSFDGRIFAFSNKYSDVYLYSTESGEKLYTLQGQKHPKVQIAFSQDGSKLATGGIDGTFIIWDTKTGEQINQGYLGDYVLDIAFSTDGSTLVTSTYGEIFFWDELTLEPLGSIEGHVGEVSILGFSPDGTLLLTSGMDETMILWDLDKMITKPQEK